MKKRVFVISLCLQSKEKNLTKKCVTEKPSIFREKDHTCGLGLPAEILLPLLKICIVCELSFELFSFQ